MFSPSVFKIIKQTCVSAPDFVLYLHLHFLPAHRVGEGLRVLSCEIQGPLFSETVVTTYQLVQCHNTNTATCDSSVVT
jgi:hypothetical protein